MFTSRHVGAVSWLQELWDVWERKRSYITRLLKQGERVRQTRQTETENERGTGGEKTLPFKVTGTTLSKQKQTWYMVLAAQTPDRGRRRSNEHWSLVSSYKCKSHPDVNTGQRLLHPSCMHYLSTGSHVSTACIPLETHGCLVTSVLFGLSPALQKGISDSPSHTTSQCPLGPLIA